MALSQSAHFPALNPFFLRSVRLQVNSAFRLGAFGGQAIVFLVMVLLLQWYGPIATVSITLVPMLFLALATTLSGSLRRVRRLATLIEPARDMPA